MNNHHPHLDSMH